MMILKSALFKDITDDEFEQIKSEMYVREKEYRKGDTIFRCGDRVSEIGVVVSGGVMIETVDPEGKKSILSRVGCGGVFAETYVVCNEPLMVDVVCGENSKILFLNFHRLLKGDNTKNRSGEKILKNLLLISANKNLVLSKRIFCTAPKGIRAKVTAYLKSESVKSGSDSFSVPFNRYQMADYLGVDRSALSKELCAMRDEGLIAFRKNNFKLLSAQFND